MGSDETLPAPLPGVQFSTIRFAVGLQIYRRSPFRAQGNGGEGGIRTHGTVTRTTVFEFYDSHAGLCRPVTKRALWFGIFTAIIRPVMCFGEE